MILSSEKVVVFMEKAAKRSGTPEGFRESLKKATTEMLVLFLLRRRPMYTYEMMSEIEVLSQGVITFNTLYLTIHRLQDFNYVEEQGKVVSEDNRARIYFAITPEGEEYLNALIREYRRYTGAVDQILGLTEGGKGA